MLLSRFWYIVLAAIACVAIVGASIVRSTYETDRGRDSETLLRGDRQQVENYLRTDARLRLDTLSEMAAVSDLTRALSAGNSRANDGPALQAAAIAVTQQLRVVNNHLPPERQGQMLLAVDSRGYVLGRVGFGENTGIGDNLGGHPLVKRALDGFVRDDTWTLGDRVYRMAARPVIHQGRYVGALVHAHEIDNAFVRRVAELLGGASVAFFADGVVYASNPGGDDRGRPAPSAEALGSRLRELAADAQWRARGSTDVLVTPDQTGATVYGSLAGNVGVNGGGFAIGRPRPALPALFLLHAPADQVRRVPWGFIALILLGGAGLGLLFIYLEQDAGDKKLRGMLNDLAERKLERLDPLTLRGNARRMALAINEAFSRAMQEELSRAGAPARRSVADLDELLGAPVAESSQPFADIAPPPPPRMSNPGLPGGLGAPPSAPHGPPMPAPSIPRASGPGMPPPPPRPSSAQAVPGAPPGVLSTGAFAAANVTGPQTRAEVTAPDPALQPFATDADEKAHWREVYNQFVETKKQCGEPTEALSYDKFAGTLQKNKAALTERAKCRAVRFTVQVKDGKATLKATPVK